MTTHDVLAFAIATEVVGRLRTGQAPWGTLFSPNTYITASRVWPVPDFVLVDSASSTTIAAEFKPPQQTKREYLTGLGQVVSYSRDFDYGLLIVPEIADDGYRIADHLTDVLRQESLSTAPIGLLSYNPSTLSATNASFSEAHFFERRLVPPTGSAQVDASFYAKWREMSPEEIHRYLLHTYDVMREGHEGGSTIRDRAFERLWSDVQAKRLHHWGGGIRNYGDGPKAKTAISKNYRNFIYHLGWSGPDGALTREGLQALHTGTLYGSDSRPFLDLIARTALTVGKHLILFNAISEYQNQLGVPFPDEDEWLNGLEAFLEGKGLLKRNPERAKAAVQGSARKFLKAEKQLWKQLELIVPRKTRVFHPGHGFVFDWARITELLQSRGT
jgi:hypothetical protein